MSTNIIVVVVVVLLCCVAGSFVIIASMDEEELDNESSDEDYVPEGADNVELPSEEESEGEAEDDGHVSGDECLSGAGKKRNKRNRTSKANKRTKLAGGSEEPTPAPINEEDQKKKTDSLWADFLKDTTKSKDVSSTLTKPTVATTLATATATASAVEDTVVSSSGGANNSSETVTVQTVYEFAGEQVIVNKVLPATASTISTSGGSSSTRGRSTAVRGGGLSSVLSQLGKKQKISTLEKSKLDWDRFKQDENIGEELSAHNKGRHGYVTVYEYRYSYVSSSNYSYNICCRYLERQDFLQRADQRQFELEKEMRTKHRSHRL